MKPARLLQVSLVLLCLLAMGMQCQERGRQRRQRNRHRERRLRRLRLRGRRTTTTEWPLEDENVSNERVILERPEDVAAISLNDAQPRNIQDPQDIRARVIVFDRLTPSNTANQDTDDTYQSRVQTYARSLEAAAPEPGSATEPEVERNPSNQEQHNETLYDRDASWDRTWQERERWVLELVLASSLNL